MSRIIFVVCVTVGLSFGLSAPAFAAVPSGHGGVRIDVRGSDTEASLWKITEPRCIKSIKQGKNLPAQCLAGSVQVGINGVDYTDAECQFNGGGCKNIFALSLPGVIPARSINYFIAAAACRNSGKRLPTQRRMASRRVGDAGSLAAERPRPAVQCQWSLGRAHWRAQ